MRSLPYARMKFMVRRGNLIVIGQGRSRRGSTYDKKRVYVPLEDRTAKGLKDAMKIGLADFGQASE